MAGLKRPVHEIPSFVSEALKTEGLEEAYQARPPYQRNDYIGWIIRAKRQETIDKRLNQMLEELRDGTKYMGMNYHARKSPVTEAPDARSGKMSFFRELIAPCGLNCGVCYAFLRKKNRCDGCLVESDRKIGYCSRCAIKLCNEHDNADFTYCFECSRFPCQRMKRMEKRYVEKYHLSLLGNLKDIHESGFHHFISSENAKWICPNCGDVLCVHKAACPGCGKEYR